VLDKVKKPGWRQVKFGDVVRQVKERVEPETSGLERYVAGDHMDTDDLRIRRWGEIGSGYLGPAFHMRFRPGQVLYGSRRTYLRKVAVADFDGICANTTFVIEPKNAEELLPEFLPFLMQTDAFNEFSVKNSKGSVNPYINFSDLARFEFALPPLGEQRRSVSLLSALEDQIEAIRAASNATTKLRKSVALDAFSLVDSPKVKMGAVADIRNGTTPRRARDEYWKGSIPWLPTGKVNDRIIDAADEFITEQALEECPLTLIPAGSTLIAMIGEGQTRGRAAMLAIDACINQNFGAVIPGKTLDPWYLFYLLESNYEALRHWSQGTNQHALSCGLLKEFPIPIPDLNRQREIVESIKEIEANERQLAERFKKTAEMRRVAHQVALSVG
jgi:type I restriction enzyme S subunit